MSTTLNGESVNTGSRIITSTTDIVDELNAMGTEKARVIDPFDPSRFKSKTSSLSGGKRAEAQITSVKVRKPEKSEYVRVTTNEDYIFADVGLIEVGEKKETYLLSGDVKDSLDPSLYRQVTLFLTKTRQGVHLLWPVTTPEGGSDNEWHVTAWNAALEAQKLWLRVYANQAEGCYQWDLAMAQEKYGEPAWPDTEKYPPSRILKVAFRNKVIDSGTTLVLRACRSFSHIMRYMMR